MSEQHVLARLQLSGEKFEIIVNPDFALNYRLGKINDIDKVLIAYEVYTDVRKGLKASSEKLMRYFKTTDVKKIADIIVKQGELQITAEQRRKLIEEKRKQLIAFITKNCIDPRTNLPIPALRVEQAMEQVKVSIDPFKEAEGQALKVIDALRSILPLKIERVRLEVKVKPEYAPKMYNFIKSYGYLEREEWLNDGSWTANVDMPAGLQTDFLDKLNKLTKGTAQVRILK
ncbi:ribosome assembly factor SBDS [Candidatus Bathyarchaeota archaeon]|nr:ribosome assembly factor SBDS [Candidatus Bathyarchaeota archaeon]MBS7617988.1 ribosome assembly factor SBDS [Candidatus Bathyarchaeota archaeon]